MAITAQTVKELREKTGAGMMECKRALQEASGDMDGAIDYLRRQGLKASEKKSTRVAADGLIAVSRSQDGRVVAMLEMNCETDFVAKNEELQNLSNKIIEKIIESDPVDDSAVLALIVEGGESFSEKISLLTAKIGEKISYRRFYRATAKSGQLTNYYLHLGAKIGVVVCLEGNKATDELAKDLAMHVAASSPQYLESSAIDPEVLAREKAIYLAQLKDEGKPENMLEKITQGKLAKFAKEICLQDQIYIKDPTGKTSVQAFLKAQDPALKIISFSRFQVGEGIEKRADDFAQEVAKLIK